MINVKQANVKLGQLKKLEWKQFLLKKLIAERKGQLLSDANLLIYWHPPNLQSHTKTIILEKEESLMAVETKIKNETRKQKLKIFFKNPPKTSSVF